MGLGHIVRLLVASVVAGVVGWIALASLSFLKVVQTLEPINQRDIDMNAAHVWAATEDLVIGLQGGTILFFATAVACISLSEIFRSRSLLYYLGATSALAAVLASATVPSFMTNPGEHIAPPTTLFALAGVAAGFTYWAIAGRPR